MRPNKNGLKRVSVDLVFAAAGVTYTTIWDIKPAHRCNPCFVGLMNESGSMFELCGD